MSQITSPRREAAIRLFERGGMTITAIAAEVGVKRQTVSEWFAKWNKALNASQPKGGPAPALPAETGNDLVSEPAAVPARPAPPALKRMTMAERRANAREIIFDGLRMGLYRKHAVQRAGITLVTFYAWMKDEEFAAAVAGAEADAVHDVVGALYEDATQGKVGQRAVPAAIWLERRHGSLYSRNPRVQVEVEHRGSIDIRRVVMSEDAINAISAYEVATARELGGAVIEGEVTALPPHEDE